MLKCEDNATEWMMACSRAFNQPMGADPDTRWLQAECVNFDKEVVEFKNSVNGFHFDIDTELFSLIPHVGAVVNIDPVHYAVFYNQPQSGGRIDLIVGRPR